MAKLYTRSGDDGSTGLHRGGRVRKDHPRVEAYGSVDELNAHLGLAAGLAQTHGGRAATIHERIQQVQNDLFALGAELATPDPAAKDDTAPKITPAHVSRLEAWVDEAEGSLEPVRFFILPGGASLASQFHLCRTVCRRAERSVVALCGCEDVNRESLAYLNRLGDLLFAWARLANQLAGLADVPWDQTQP